MAKRKSGARGGRSDRGTGGFRGGWGRGNFNNRGRGGAELVSSGPRRGRGRGHFHSGSTGSIQDELDVDFTLYAYANAPSPAQPIEPPFRGRGMFAYRGRGRAVPFIPSQLGAGVPFPGRGRGFDLPRRQVQGIGAPKDRRPVPVRVGAKQPLSSLLQQERPLLRPIVFVPSTETRFLFQNEEELLQPIVEHGDDLKSPIPTADRVARVFSGGNVPSDVWGNPEEYLEDEIEVVDFKDFGKLLALTSTTSITPNHKTKMEPMENTSVHELTTRNSTPQTPPLPGEIERLTEMVDKTLSSPNGISTAPQAAGPAKGSRLFYVDTPSNLPNLPDDLQQPPSDNDDDVIVYDAPHPRNTSRMAHREDERMAYERPAALSTLMNNEQSISIAADESLSSAVPRTVMTSFIPEPPSFSSVTFAFPKSPSIHNADPTSTATATSSTTTTPRLRVPPITTPRQEKLWTSRLNRANKQKKGTTYKLGKTPFGAYGAVREESVLRRLDGRDDRYDERRGDSDIEWGTMDNDGEDMVSDGKGLADVQVEEPELDADMKRVLDMLEKRKGKGQETEEVERKQENDVNNRDDHGMEVDVDIDTATMQRFIKGLTCAGGGAYVTMDDLECERIIRLEDEGDDDVEERGSSGNNEEDDRYEETVDVEEEDALKIEEEKLMHDGVLGNLDGLDGEETDDLGEGVDSDSEEDDDDLDDEDYDEEYDYADISFQARLDRLRARSKEQDAADVDFDDDDDPLERNMTWADKDEAFIQHLNAILDEEEDIPKDRKPKKRLITSLSDDYDDLDWSSSPARRRKDKYLDLPPELRVQWEKDRQKKAQRKKEREVERLARAADPLSKKKGGKNGRKAMLAAAAVDEALPNRVTDMTTLVQQIRRFIADVGGPSSMSLPPADKETRKNVHEIAAAFKLKSVSKNKGDARYITLIKTTKTGIQINEGKIAWIVRRSGARGDSFMYEDRKGKRAPRHREGDVVGNAAPKLDESNVGFRLLAMMGWSEGDRIGASTNGLEAPLLAIIKTSKLGLGAKK